MSLKNWVDAERDGVMTDYDNALFAFLCFISKLKWEGQIAVSAAALTIISSMWRVTCIRTNEWSQSFSQWVPLLLLVWCLCSGLGHTCSCPCTAQLSCATCHSWSSISQTYSLRCVRWGGGWPSVATRRASAWVVFGTRHQQLPACIAPSASNRSDCRGCLLVLN